MELAGINDWLKTNKLSINVNKCKYMIFHTFRKKVNNVKIKMNNTTINRVKELNFPGLTIDENLTWKNHINKFANKILKSTDILNKLKHFLPLNAKVLIYNSLIVSHLNFCVLAWGYKCDIIVKLQKKIVKYNAHTDPLFKTLRLLKVNDILKVQEYKFYYKILKYYVAILFTKPTL